MIRASRTTPSRGWLRPSHSVDAVVFNVLGTPTEAYGFASGREIRLAPYDRDGVGTRPLRLRRPLDFTAATDHSKGFGAYRVCFVPGHPGYDSSDCERARAASISADPALREECQEGRPQLLATPPRARLTRRPGTVSEGGTATRSHRR